MKHRDCLGGRSLLLIREAEPDQRRPEVLVQSAADTTPPSVTVLTPNGGEFLQPNQQFLIQWQSSDNVGVIAHDVKFSRDGGLSFSDIAVNLPGSTKSFPWTVPAQSTSQGVIRVVARDAAGNQTADASNGAFSIQAAIDVTPPSVRVIAPNGGEMLMPNQQILIQWQSSDNIGVASHDVKFSPNAGATFIDIATNLPGTAQNFSWTVPNMATTSGLIRVVARDGAGNQAADASDVTFTIKPGIGPNTDPDEPSISGFAPPQGAVFTPVTITGAGFKFTPPLPKDSPSPEVSFFDGFTRIPAAVLGFSETAIMTRVPNGAKTGKIEVVNTRDNSVVSSDKFTVLPTIQDFTPKRGAVTTPVKITGTGLYNTPKFFFTGENGADVPANFSLTDQPLASILVAVPKGAITGPIKVITEGGGMARTASDFSVPPAVPRVGDFNPKFGPAGTNVAIMSAKDEAGMETEFEAIQEVSFLANPDGVGKERRIKLGKGQFAVSGDRQRIDVVVPEGAVTGTIRVVNESGAGATRPFRVPLSPPASLAARSVAGPKIELTWKDTSTTESGFRLERSVGGNPFNLLVTLAKDMVFYQDADVSAGTTYSYQLKAFNEKDGESAPSNQASATAGGTLKVQPIRLNFTAIRNGNNPDNQVFMIARANDQQPEQNWTVSADVPWLNLTPTSGMTPAMVTVMVDIFGLKAGNYGGLITVRSTGPDNSVAVIPVTLVIKTS